jgi:hypothetical protein
MPAPDRLPLDVSSTVTFPFIPKGLIRGHYTDVEVDALLEALPVGISEADAQLLIDAALAAVVVGSLTEEQIAEILAAIPDAPITRDEFDALVERVAALDDKINDKVNDLFDSLIDRIEEVDANVDALALQHDLDKIDLLALIDAIPAGVITVHEGKFELGIDGTPLALISEFAIYDQGLHFFPASGVLINVVRSPIGAAAEMLTLAIQSSVFTVHTSATSYPFSVQNPEASQSKIVMQRGASLMQFTASGPNDMFELAHNVDLFATDSGQQFSSLEHTHTTRDIDGLLDALALAQANILAELKPLLALKADKNHQHVLADLPEVQDAFNQILPSLLNTDEINKRISDVEFDVFNLAKAKADITDLAVLDTAVVSGLAKKTDKTIFDSFISNIYTPTALDHQSQISDRYTKAEVDQLIAANAAGVLTDEQVAQIIALIPDGPITQADLDNLIDGLQAYIEGQDQQIRDELQQALENIAAELATSASLNDADQHITTSFLTVLNKITTKQIQTEGVSFNLFGRTGEIGFLNGKLSSSADGAPLRTVAHTDDLTGFVNKAQMDAAINKVDVVDDVSQMIPQVNDLMQWVPALVETVMDQRADFEASLPTPWLRATLLTGFSNNGANILIIRKVFGGDSIQLVGDVRNVNATMQVDQWIQIATVPFYFNRNTPDFVIGTTDNTYRPGTALAYISTDGKLWVKAQGLVPSFMSFNIVASAFPANLRAADLDDAVKANGGPSEKNVNTATAAELQKTSGIGPALSKRIVDNRPYVSIDDLATRVSGLSVATALQMGLVI